MKIFPLLFVTFFVSLQWDRAHGFCGGGSLHANLVRAVVRSSDWLKQYYQDNTTTMAPHEASSMMVSLRLSGHQPDTLVNNFKNRRHMSITETLLNYLDEQEFEYGNLTKIPTGRLAYIVMGVIAVCENPNDFHGYNLYKPLLSGINKFKVSPTFNNYFQYSLVAIALCNGGLRVPQKMVNELVKFANRRCVNAHFVDINALALVALSCIRRQRRSTTVYQASWRLVRKIISKRDLRTGAFGNQFSTALAVEALVAAGVSTWKWSCEKAMRNILSYQNEKGSFGNALANIQITPSLLGESLIDLKNLACPAIVIGSNESISVIVKLSINDTKNPVRNVSALIITVPKGTTAFTILQLAGERNPCYKAKYQTSPSFGRFITSICDVDQDPAAGLYWLIYENGSPAQFGVDQLKPKQGTRLTFKYQKV